jgi:hypothetical protein
VHRVSLLGLIGIASLSILAPGCHEFDTERAIPKRGTVGEEIYGVLCDRVGAQSLRDDLTGASFRNVCHKPIGSSRSYQDEVDTKQLPPVGEGLTDVDGNIVSVDKQRADRAKAVGRVEALARRRADLIRALDATFPEEKIAIKDVDNPDPKKSCNARGGAKSGEGLLTDALADMLGRMGDLYNDGTLPHATGSLARVIDEFKKSKEAQAAWSRLSGREGYRPIDTALGTVRPVIAYPNLRDFSNASLRLLSADSTPYETNPQRDGDGNRIPVAGPGNSALNKMLEVAHEELLASKAEKLPPPLVLKTDAATGRVIVSRPRDNLELMQAVLMQEDDIFKNGSPRFIVKRDNRGYARIQGGALPAPFVDEDKDGLPDLDGVGRFKTANGSVAPSPFSFPGAPDASRDEFDRATAGTNLLYEYIDTSRTFAAQMMKDMKVLVNSDPEQKHETMMDMVGGLQILMGPRETRSKSYANKTVQYDGVRPSESPMLDLVYAIGAILGDKTADQTLAMARELFTTKSKDMARVTGALNTAFDIAQKHPEAVIPRKSTFWDETLDATAALVKEPGLLEDVLRALATPEAQELGNVFSKFAKFKDEISYDSNEINGPAYNVTTKSTSELNTPVDRGQPMTGTNRSALQRFLGLISDTQGVTACNKPQAAVHAKLGSISVTMPIAGTYAECEVFKIENLANFYIDVIAEGWQYDPDSKPNKRGAMYLRNDTLREGIALGIGAATTNLLEDSSGITGFVDTGNNKILTPSPKWLNRLVFFDTKKDSPNDGDKNFQTNHFIRDLSGDFIGTSVCPERTIDDPLPGAVDASRDGKVHGLRNCPAGQHLQERDRNTIFTLEHFGFYPAMKALTGMFAKHGREDLFVELSSVIYRHLPGQEASADECRLAGNKTCPKDGANTYEPLIAEAFASDVLPAIGALVKALETMPIERCDATNAAGECTATTTVSGIDVAAAATRAALDPAYSKELGLKDRNGLATAKRNDGTTNPQVTPAYLITNALTAIDLAFDKYEEQNPTDKDRRANWRRARSQLVDQFLGTTGIRSNSTFTNPSIPTMTPAIVDMLRAQLWSHCPKSFVPPYEKCKWARDELAQKAEETITGPLATTGIDMMDAIRRDPEGRHEMERLLEYLLDEASKNDALASVLASANDMIQLLRDDDNLVPLYKVLAAAVDGSKYDDRGKLVEKSMLDAQMALLARLSGKYITKDGKEICANEKDPNQVLTKILGKVVTPIKDGEFKGQSPLEVIIDVIADVNRADPTQPYEGTLKQSDYASVSENVVDFLANKERGLEQFYEVIRQGTKF